MRAGYDDGNDDFINWLVWWEISAAVKILLLYTFKLSRAIVATVMYVLQATGSFSFLMKYPSLIKLPVRLKEEEAVFRSETVNV